MTKQNDIRFVSPGQWKRIERWSRRKPVFALMGEFSAGKSTLMNFLLRQNTLPTQVTATQLPPVWFSWGKRPAYVRHHDGSKREIGLDQLDQVGVQDAQFIRIYLEADILEAVDLIDTPGISDPKISADVWQRAVGQANGVLWCTHATQAWRETERATWASLPERLHNNSLLLITRADALDQKDRQKVLRRVNRETGPLFNRSILFSARDAITARDQTGDAEMWARSGGGKMIDSFLEITESVMNARSEMLSRYQVDRGLTVVPTSPTALRKASDENEASRADTAPLQLFNPVESEPVEAREIARPDVAPVRPSRVERRQESDAERAGRSRIEADEAEKLRAQLGADKADDGGPGDVPEEDLKTVFRLRPDTGVDAPQLDAVVSLADAQPDYSEEPEYLDEGEDHDDNLITDTEIAAEDADPVAGDDLSVAADDPDTLLASLTDRLSDDTETGIEAEAVLSAPKTTSDAEDAVSSITALLAADLGVEASVDGVDVVPEPLAESRGTNILPLPEAPFDPIVASNPAPVTQGGDAQDVTFEIPNGAPLSAATMWREIAEAEALPENPQELLSVFRAFLEEFDLIAVEHHARQMQDALQSIPGADKQSGAEWHVL